jgi:Flp pilus assembly protein TadG
MKLERLHERKLRQLLRDAEGASLVEFAVTMPLFFLLLFGLVQVGLMFWAQLGLQHGVEMAARCASLGDNAQTQNLGITATCSSATPSTVQNYAAANSYGLAPPATVFGVGTCTGGWCSQAQANCLSVPPAGGNLVTATYPFTAITYLYSITLTASSCYPKV